MRARHLLLGAPLLLIALAAASPPRTVTYALPQTEEDFTLPPGEGAELTVGNCAACHSLDYIRTQPRGKGAQFWKDNVAKMIAVYKAPIAPADADAIAAYLAKTYGE
ncbi:cytochrome C [Sphingobium algorifonticola]|uniref:Cytochrome C n=1 Tax=Sphingobium algorifonticola TaxID=2008318 RepID=A0A437J5D6_9SPHN|nr:cytochrome C [Sphingobium algorifonticola]RVT40150.1 cytochrome C [Sphingobium algorifonticola]